METCSKRAGLTSVRNCAASAIFKRVLFAVMLVALTAAARHRTANFIVEAPDPNYAAQVAQAAEHYRRQLAIEWLGQELPNWSQPCPITVNVGHHLGAGGATTFVFDRGEVYGWRMTIQGPPDRLIDSVLPHEITHMIFASHFRRPLPRWADEGAATSVEHVSERNKYRNLLHQFLRTGQTLPLSHMFAVKDYPANPLPLYAQSHSLAEYLIQLGGKRKYVQFVGDGLQSGDWAGAVRRHYGISDLGQLQNTWLVWVRQGSPTLRPHPTTPEAASPETLLAAAGQTGATAQSNLRGQSYGSPHVAPAGHRLAMNQGQPGPQSWSNAQASVQPANWPRQAEPSQIAGSSPPTGWRPARLSGAPEARNTTVHGDSAPAYPADPHPSSLAANASEFSRAVPVGRLVPVERLPGELVAAVPMGAGSAQSRTATESQISAQSGTATESQVAVTLPPLREPASSSPGSSWNNGSTAAGSVSAGGLGAATVANNPATIPSQVSASQLARPQTPQGPRHIIIQWGTR